MTLPTTNWIQHLQKTVMDMGAIPLSGYIPEFPWKALQEKIATLLGDAHFDLKFVKMDVIQAEALTSGFGDQPSIVTLDLTPLNGSLFWLMGKQEATHLASLALSSAQKEFSSQKLQEGFYYYLISEIVQTIDALKPFDDLSLKMAKTIPLPQEESLCIDVEVSFAEQIFWGRVICPLSTHEQFKHYFSNPQPDILRSEVAKNIPLTLHLEVGRTELSAAEWREVQPGDVVLLDQCSFDIRSHKGYVTLMLGTIPLLRARVKESVLKIVDYAIYQQEEVMSTDHPEETSDTENFDTEEQEHLWSDEGASVEQMISPEKIPLILSIEVAKLTMNLDEVLQLKPGNVLELPVKPEQGVDVTISGKVVAKAELIKMGEMLGVKILKLGK